MKITLTDGKVLELLGSTTVAGVASAISEGLRRNAIAGKVDGKLVDLSYPIEKDAEVVIVTSKDPEALDIYRHTCSHVLAQAVKSIYPTCSLAIGPTIDTGFYYDIDFKTPITIDDLPKIEEEMKKIIKADLAIERFELPREEAIALMKKYKEPYKVQLIKDLPEDSVISFYKQGDFTDLCRGPHLPSTGMIKAFKLTSIAGAYWRGNEKNKMLTRIYGTAFFKKSEMEAYFTKLFALLNEGKGFPFFLPNGMVVKNELIDYWRKIHRREGYVEVSTPIMLSRTLWETSGHWDHYKENMYTTKVDDEDYAIKPMNCPGGMLIYKLEPRSYKDLPMRIGELGLVHRHERSGQLHGLMRVRCFTQDDAHIYMTPEQITPEIKGVVRLIDEVYSLFGFKYHVELSTRPDNSIGSDEDWNQATEALREALDELKLPYTVNEGDGAFYGPKIDFHLTDSIGRTWQCGTIQLDFQLPQRFNAEYVGEDGEKHRPIMIHRVIFGSIERFIGILIEHFEGKFPLWLAPVQVKIMDVSEKSEEYCKKVYQKLFDAGLRPESDLRPEKIGKKIRDAELEKVPYMLVIGEQEAANGEVAIRKRGQGDVGKMKLEDFVELCKKQVETMEKW